jgi:uncharacterized membrane protein
MDLLTGYRLLVEAASAGANVTALADEFNKALEGGGSLSPDFGVLAQRLAEEARWSFFVSVAVGVVVLAVAAVAAAFLFRYRRRLVGWLWLWVWGGGLLRPGGGKQRTLLFDEEVLAVVAAVAVVGVALASAVLLGPAVREPFSAIGLLGPEGRIGGYPSEVAAGAPVRLHVYVYNHMGAPVWFVVYVKVSNSTGEPPLPERPVVTLQRLLLHNETWVKPFTVALNSTGRQRVVAELWAVYPNGTVAYTGRYVQLWVDVRG